MAPPAGPDSTSRTGKRIAVSTVGQPAARQHQKQRADKAFASQHRFEIGEIAADQRLDIGVGAGRREALVFAHLGRDVARQGDRHPGQPRGQDLAGTAFVRRVGKAVQKSDRDDLDALGDQAVGQRGQRCLVERHKDPAAGVDALAHRKTQPARHQGRRQVDIYIVLLEPVFVPDLDRVAKALGRQQRGLGPLALDDRISSERRTVNDDRQIGRSERRLAQYRVKPLEHRALGSVRGRQDLGAVAFTTCFERDIGKGAADINAKPSALLRHAFPLVLSQRGRSVRGGAGSVNPLTQTAARPGRENGSGAPERCPAKRASL